LGARADVPLLDEEHDNLTPLGEVALVLMMSIAGADLKFEWDD
jgi:hypothetical protein